MSKSDSLIVLPPEATQVQVENYLANFQRMEELHSRLGIGFQAMQGACLAKLRILHGGGEEAGRVKTASCGFNWEAYIKAKFGFSVDKAQRLVKVWHGMQLKLGKLSAPDQRAFLGLLTKPLASFLPADLTRLKDLTHKVTDSDTQLAFLTECGFMKPARKLSHNPNPANNGGDHRQPTAVELRIQDELFGRVDVAGALYECWASKVRVGKASVPLWQMMSEVEKAQMEAALEQSIRQRSEMLAQLREAKKRK